MKKSLFFIALFVGILSYSQDSKAVYIKANALFIPIGIINAGLEFQLSDKVSLQGDVFISPWKSFTGKHAQIYMGHLEGRYYFNEVFKKWYVGINAGTGVFDVTKWNYIGTENFQRGFTIMIGGTVGYQFQWKEKWNIDLFLGAGTAQSQYHGYTAKEEPPGFYRYDGAMGWNKSGEFLPYKIGFMVAYRIN